jgi:hypothetical protein
VKKQTSKVLVHNSVMTLNTVTFRRRLFTGGLVLALVVGCTTITPTPTLGPTLPPTPAATPTGSQEPTNPASSQPNETPTSTGTSETPTPQSSDATSTPTPGSTGPATPGPTIDPTVAAQIDAVVAQVPPIRELQPTKDVPYKVITRDDFSQYLMATANEDTTPEWRAAEERFLKRMGLLPQDANLDQLLLQLYTEQVAAYYDPADGTFYIIQRDAPFGPVDKVTTAHEYTHALQDQNFGLEVLRIKDPVQGDAMLGQLSAIEGDATLTSQNWMRDNLSQDEQLQLLQDALGQLGDDSLSSMPLILRRQLEFPYAEGLSFVTDLWSPGPGGYDAINQAIQTPPASTEQILHSDKYLSHEAPVAITPTDLTATLGSGFTNVYQQVMGELNIQVLMTGGEKPALDIPGLPVEWPHAEDAAGWGGDFLNMYENGDQWLIDWQTTWDTPADATEFLARIQEIQATLSGTLHFSTDGQSVRIDLASDPGLFGALPPV